MHLKHTKLLKSPECNKIFCQVVEIAFLKFGKQKKKMKNVCKNSPRGKEAIPVNFIELDFPLSLRHA